MKYILALTLVLIMILSVFLEHNIEGFEQEGGNPYVWGHWGRWGPWGRWNYWGPSRWGPWNWRFRQGWEW